MSYFFELDQDEILFQGRVYVDYFNLYPDLRFDTTLRHIERFDEMSVLKALQSSTGWNIEIKYSNLHFLLDTHFHGTSTLFCIEKGTRDKTSMLAFLGFFLPVIRDDWKT